MPLSNLNLNLNEKYRALWFSLLKFINFPETTMIMIFKNYEDHVESVIIDD